MKKTLALLAAGIIPAMLVAIPFTLAPNDPWEKTADDAVSIDYKGNKIWKTVGVKPSESLKAKTLYRITFEAKSTASPTPVLCVFKSVIDGKKQELVTSFYPTTEFRKYTVYFYSGETPGKDNPYIYFNPSDPFQMEIKNIKLDEMTDDLLYGENLLLQGDFEEGCIPLVLLGKGMRSCVQIVNNANFLSGEKTLLLDCIPGKTTGITSGFIPAIPGKEIEVRFYAKSENAVKLTVQLDFWMRDSKHFYRAFNFKPEKDWKEFSLKLNIPDDTEKYKALSRHLMKICLRGRPLSADSNARIYIDCISCTIRK